MNKKMLGGLLLTAMLILIVAYSWGGRQAAPQRQIIPPEMPGGTVVPVIPVPGQDENARRLYRFIADRLTGPYGVYTNLLETDQSAEAATGHEVLSESASLLLRYAALAGNRELFETQWELARKTFDMDTGFSYRYSPRSDKRYPLNAAVDDLRMIRALREAAEAFGMENYRTLAEHYSQRFYHYNVSRNKLFDIYDSTYKINNKSITLCYINLRDLQNLSNNVELLKNMEAILEHGYVSDAFPFYHARYEYSTGEYSSGNINTVESLLSILSLAEVGRHKPTSLAFIKERVVSGDLYGQYTPEGKPANDIRSTAIYAITAMIGAEIGDQELYRDSIRRMEEFRVTDPGSELYGGFGDTGSGQAYSFDNLMALLAYVYPVKQK